MAMHEPGRQEASAPYAALGPDIVLDAAEQCGHRCDGRILALGSYENRVYQIGLEDGGFVVAKFYRPGRWTDEAILEEHAFSLELAAREIPVVAPLVSGGETLHRHAGYRYALFPRRGGRWPELGTADDRVWMGRFIARIHSVGALEPFQQRESLSVERLGHRPVAELLASDWIPAHLLDSYRQITAELLEVIEQRSADVGELRWLRIHGDCHRGNVLWTDEGPHFVDLDDCVMGPAVQDLWLFLAGGRGESEAQLADLLEGYEQFFDFDYRELALIEPLRTLRMIHYTAWVAGRWKDPAFPRAFPWLADSRYWEEHILNLKEQRAALDEPPLALTVR
jgi:Ser/Thr protein kinase RdoA (MazF antagonist)